MSRKEKFQSLLKKSEEVEKQIEDHGKVFQDNIDNPDYTPKIEFIKSDLSVDLQSIEKHIIELSRNCLYQLNDWNNLLVGMDTQINEVSGLIQRVKSDAGSRLIDPMLETGNPPIPEQKKEIPQKSHYFTFPDYPFDINTRALDFVGHHVDDVNSNTELPPLITKINPDENVPEFWSKRQDFFQPIFEVKQEGEEYSTSFSDFYKFNPAPELQIK